MQTLFSHPLLNLHLPQVVDATELGNVTRELNHFRDFTDPNNAARKENSKLLGGSYQGVLSSSGSPACLVAALTSYDSGLLCGLLNDDDKMQAGASMCRDAYHGLLHGQGERQAAWWGLAWPSLAPCSS